MPYPSLRQNYTILYVLLGAFLASAAWLIAILSSTPTGDSADAGFARDMSTHHKQAVEMSFIIRESSTDDSVRLLAYDIANTQSTQSGMMMGWLQQWKLPQSSSSLPMAWMAGGDMTGNHGKMSSHENLMPGMATASDLEKLKSLSGKEADILYLQLMIQHHKGGVQMARGILNRSSRPEVRQLAQTIVDGQQAEIKLMEQMIKERRS